jgi:hypothetical protein
MRHVADRSSQCRDGIRRHPNRARRRKPSVLGKAAGGFCLSATGGRLFFVSGGLAALDLTRLIDRGRTKDRPHRARLTSSVVIADKNCSFPLSPIFCCTSAATNMAAPSQ